MVQSSESSTSSEHNSIIKTNTIKLKSNPFFTFNQFNFGIKGVGAPGKKMSGYLFVSLCIGTRMCLEDAAAIVDHILLIM